MKRTIKLITILPALSLLVSSCGNSTESSSKPDSTSSEASAFSSASSSVPSSSEELITSAEDRSEIDFSSSEAVDSTSTEAKSTSMEDTSIESQPSKEESQPSKEEEPQPSPEIDPDKRLFSPLADSPRNVLTAKKMTILINKGIDIYNDVAVSHGFIDESEQLQKLTAGVIGGIANTDMGAPLKDFMSYNHITDEEFGSALASIKLIAELAFDGDPTEESILSNIFSNPACLDALVGLLCDIDLDHVFATMEDMDQNGDSIDSIYSLLQMFVPKLGGYSLFGYFESLSVKEAKEALREDALADAYNQLVHMRKGGLTAPSLRVLLSSRILLAAMRFIQFNALSVKSVSFQALTEDLSDIVASIKIQELVGIDKKFVRFVIHLLTMYINFDYDIYKAILDIKDFFSLVAPYLVEYVVINSNPSRIIDLDVVHAFVENWIDNLSELTKDTINGLVKLFQGVISVASDVASILMNLSIDDFRPLAEALESAFNQLSEMDQNEVEAFLTNLGTTFEEFIAQLKECKDEVTSKTNPVLLGYLEKLFALFDFKYEPDYRVSLTDEKSFGFVGYNEKQLISSFGLEVYDNENDQRYTPANITFSQTPNLTKANYIDLYVSFDIEEINRSFNVLIKDYPLYPAELEKSQSIEDITLFLGTNHVEIGKLDKYSAFESIPSFDVDFDSFDVTIGYLDDQGVFYLEDDLQNPLQPATIKDAVAQVTYHPTVYSSLVNEVNSFDVPFTDLVGDGAGYKTIDVVNGPHLIYEIF